MLKQKVISLSVKSDSIKESFSRCTSFVAVINKLYSKSRNILVRCVEYLKMVGTVNMEN